MLCVDRANFKQFNGSDLANLLASEGWDAVLPNSLHDEQLLCVAEQLRGLLSGQEGGADEKQPSAGLVLTLLLLSKVMPEAHINGGSIDVELETLHDAMALLSFSVDREITNRVLNQRDDQSGNALVSAMAKLSRPRKSRYAKTHHKNKAHS